MNAINLTPHDVVLVDGTNNPILTIPASGSLARCRETVVTTGSIVINGITIPTTEKNMGEVVGLPDPQDGVVYIVSLPVKKAVPDRRDVLVPNESVRDANGNIIGCRSLSPHV